MSVLNKIWKIKNKDENASLLSKLLKNRGLSGETEIECFFHPTAERDFHDPFLMKDMRRAVERIGTAIEKSERVMIFGDYDVDGITGCAILMRTLSKLGAKVSSRLPHRIEDGYGLREKFIHEFKKLNVKLIITVDNGIACTAEITLANELGVDTIITDHHMVPEKIPQAFAILHPKLTDSGYPFADLTGAGVALKLAQALLFTRIPDKTKVRGELEKLLDLACMGTIADIGPLLGENRYIVKEGLRALEHTRWPGLSRLKQSAGIKGKISTHAIGFLLGPRINAAGRISHPSQALKLLLQGADQSDALAETLEQLNKKRQKMLGESMEIADKLAEKQCGDSIIIISHPEFHGGIIGLLAAKLTEKYFRPAVVMEERRGVLIGSCRSIPGFNIFDALNTAKELFTHFGGHAAAAGFDLPKAKLAEFKKRLKKYVKKLLNADQCRPILPVDCELSHGDISTKTLEILKWFEPFGHGNETPLFICRNIPIREYSTVGSDKQHLRIRAQLNNSTIDCIAFRLGKFAPQLRNVETIDAVCEIEENNWNNRKKIQLKVIDFRIPA